MCIICKLLFTTKISEIFCANRLAMWGFSKYLLQKYSKKFFFSKRMLQTFPLSAIIVLTNSLCTSFNLNVHERSVLNMTLEELIYEKISTLSPGQRKAAEFILQNKEGFSYATLAKLSKELSVSETTIIRLAYSLGFDSFSAMQQRLREEILKSPPKAAPEFSSQSCIASTLRKVTDTFTNWTASLDEQLVCKIVDALLGADRILVIGGRSSYSTATWLGERLNLLLGNAYVIRQFYDPRFDLLADVTEKTTAINIAFARYTKSTYQYASLVKKRGAKLISFTDTPSSPFNAATCIT